MSRYRSVELKTNFLGTQAGLSSSSQSTYQSHYAQPRVAPPKRGAATFQRSFSRSALEVVPVDARVAVEKVGSPTFPETSPVCHLSHEVDHLSLRTDPTRLRTHSENTDETPVREEGELSELSHVQEVLGPPLEFLPKDIEIQELNAYRLDYQNFRAGHASGARGEMADLCASVREQNEASAKMTYHPSLQKRPRLVPLIGLDLATSSAVRSAASAASEHLEEMEQIHHAFECRITRVETSEDSGLSGPDLPELPLQAPRKSCLKKSDKSEAKLRKPERHPMPRQSSAPAAQQTGIGFFTHIAVSMLCLVPYLKTQSGSLFCLFLPTTYAAYIVGMWVKLRFRVPNPLDQPPSVITRVLRMERLVREGSVPHWFPHLASVVYLIMVFQLELGHSFQSYARSQRSTLLSAGPQRHDYNCWGTDQQDVADCVLVRHAGYTITVSFYICLIVMAVCNRKVKGSDLVGEHERSLEELFPMEAPSLLCYVERSVKSNSTFWRSHRHYKAQSVVLSLSWTLMSFGVYWELMQGAKTKTAQVVFCSALICTYALQYTLLRHVLLRVILHLEGVKARAAAMAFCDEEGVLPFTSAHSVYVWFSVRRNVQAQNEVAYQNASPIFTAMLICAAACSCWVISQLRQRGITVFGLTSRGGASLMVVASALVSSIFVGTLLEIGKLEDAHVRQLRIAHLRLEHARCILKVQKELEQAPSKKRLSRDSMVSVADEQDMEGALLMIERVIALLEQHDVKPTMFGVEIGSKSFQVVYAALLSNLWYLMVWGVLIPVINAHDD
eukprot:g3815.t2